MTLIFKDIPSFDKWKIIRPISKGWSKDNKYYIKTLDGKELLLKITDISEHERKTFEFQSLELLSNLDALMSRPIDFGICSNGQAVYTLFTWINGEDAEKLLPELDFEKQYKLGVDAGRILREIHRVPAPANQPNWTARYNRKIERNINNYRSCDIRFQGDSSVIKYIEENRQLLKDRPQTFQHGDYHTGNMVITQEGRLGIIDFDRLDYGDPWEEFNRIIFSASISTIFSSGYINGYFENEVPDLFFKIMALYIASNTLASIPWAMPFGHKDIKVMLQNAENVLNWYSNFKKYIPCWYISEYKK